MHHLNPIALAIPFFLLLIAVELVWARARGRTLYRFADAITDLSCGVTSQVFVVFYAAVQLSVYAWVFDHHRLFTLRPTAAQWLVAFVGVDFFYYWWHRLSHEVSFLWAAHVVHHSSEDYNLAVALRQAILTSWTGLPFYLPLALAGVPPLVYGLTLAFSTLYQFWIHTQLVGKLGGPVEWLINLPQHHRVHHAINPRYLDKNYGATLIVWDRLFGTFAEENEAPVYGITKAIGSFNPAWAQVHYWVELVQLSWAAPRLADKLRVWWKSPAWAPEGIAKPPVKEVSPERFVKYEPTTTPGVKRYVLAWYGLVIAATFALMLLGARLQPGVRVGAALLVLSTLFTFGGLMERRRWAVPAEAVRLFACAASVAWLLRAPIGTWLK